MMQPPDYAPGYDPYATNPQYQSQLSREEVVQPADSQPRGGNGKQQQKHGKRKWNAKNGGPKSPVCDYTQKGSKASHDENSMSWISLLVPLAKEAWRSKSVRSKAKGFTVISLVIVTAASYGAFEEFGISGFAHADSIKKATQPLERQITETNALLAKVSAQLADQLAAWTAVDIRTKTRKQCSGEADPWEREELIKSIEGLQDQYKAHKGVYYAVPRCSEL